MGSKYDVLLFILLFSREPFCCPVGRIGWCCCLMANNRTLEVPPVFSRPCLCSYCVVLALASSVHVEGVKQVRQRMQIYS